MPLFVAFVTGFLLTAGLVPLTRRIALRFHLCTPPSNDRWHSGVVPNIGGVAMFLPLALVAAFSGAFGEIWMVMAAAAGMFALGVADDIRPVRASTKLAVQTLIAAGLYDLWKNRTLLAMEDAGMWAVGVVVSFVSAFMVIRWLIRYVATHDFRWFAWYRIAFGLVVLATAYFGWVDWQGL